MDQTQIRVVHSQDDRREEAGKLQEDRIKAVIAKAISEATKAVEKASTEAQSYTAEVREGSDGKLASRMSSPIEQVREVTQFFAEEDESSKSDEDEAKKAATRDKPKKSS